MTMNKVSFNKVVVWGHKLKSAKTANTFAFIHNAWVRTFKYLGYEVLWLDDTDDVSGISFENCLFLTEGQVDDRIPIVRSSKYVLHNCLDLREKYQDVFENCLNIGMVNAHLKRRKVEQLEGEAFAFYQPEPDFTPNEGCDNRTLHQLWATDLLPSEFDPEDTVAMQYSRQNRVFWVGSICDGVCGNINELSQLALVCRTNKTPFIHAKLENNLAPRAIAESWIAPTVLGQEQIRIDYLPCRAFKNLSYGRMTGTNSKFVHSAFGEKIPFSTDMEELYRLSVEWEETGNRQDLKELIKLVKDKHTFVNRVSNILRVL